MSKSKNLKIIIIIIIFISEFKYILWSFTKALIFSMYHVPKTW